MSGTGKYTTYAPPASSKNTLLAKLYPSAPTAAFVGKETDYLAQVIKLATAKVDSTGVGGIQPSDGVQQGDGTTVGTVNLNFTGAPDLTTVTHDTANTPSGNPAGGPANAYVPDVTSPGPGKTDGTDKVGDPGIGVNDLPGTEGYVPGGPTTGTRNPQLKSTAVAQHNVLGDSSSTAAKLGDSGANS